MTTKLVKRLLSLITFTVVSTSIFAQNKVPLGIHYQAVARDNFGNELANKKISVKFSIISEDPLSAPVYQEVHQDVITSKFGVFSIVIGHGILTGNGTCTSLSEIAWENANHYLKVEVKFENTFMDMGTMQFLAVPYALYAQKSLEPGPEGPKGDKGDQGEPGDPASDDQTLSVENIDGSDYLAISEGNKVKISTIERDGDPQNEIQNLVISSNKLKITNNVFATEWDLTPYLDNTDSQNLTYDAANRILGISGNANTINLTELKNDADANPLNEIQDLQLSGDNLSVTGKTGANVINLGIYRDNTDNQQLTYSESSNSLSITDGNSVTLGTLVAFRAKKTNVTSAPMPLSNVDFVYNENEYNDGDDLNLSNGTFTVQISGIYAFDIKYVAPNSGDGRMLMLYKNGNNYETLGTSISSSSTLYRNITIKLTVGDTIKLVVYTGTGTEIGTGYFSGHKVN